MGKNYMTQLSKWARWMLPWQEADAVIADYHDFTGSPPRPWDELLRDLGRPRDAVKALVRPKQYFVWLAAFGIMAVCLLGLVSSPMFSFWHILLGKFTGGWTDILYGCVLFAPGILTALVWFRRQGRKMGRIPKAIPALVTVLTAYIAGALLLCGFRFYTFLLLLIMSYSGSLLLSLAVTVCSRHGPVTAGGQRCTCWP